MMPIMETLIKLAADHHKDLTSAGQTEAIRDAGQPLLENLRESDAVQEVKKDDKTSAKEDRHLIFKKLYDTVNRINKVGRLVFENDPVKLPLFQSKW